MDLQYIFLSSLLEGVNHFFILFHDYEFHYYVCINVLLIVWTIKELMYCEYKVIICNFMNCCLQESVILEFVIIRILFFLDDEYFFCMRRIAPANYTIAY